MAYIFGGFHHVVLRAFWQVCPARSSHSYITLTLLHFCDRSSRRIHCQPHRIKNPRNMFVHNVQNAKNALTQQPLHEDISTCGQCQPFRLFTGAANRLLAQPHRGARRWVSLPCSVLSIQRRRRPVFGRFLAFLRLLVLGVGWGTAIILC